MNPEEVFKDYVTNIYQRITVLEEYVPGYSNMKTIKTKATKNLLTYREQLVNEIIEFITEKTYPFGNIDGVAIPEEVYLKYKSTPGSRENKNFERIKWLDSD